MREHDDSSRLPFNTLAFRPAYRGNQFAFRLSNGDGIHRMADVLVNLMGRREKREFGN